MQNKHPRKPVHKGPPQQVRIIGGIWKRTPLPVLKADGLRPTPDRVRETVFNWIQHQIDGLWEQCDVLDLFAGTGALGFEAASRGARSVLMVDSFGPAVQQLQAIQEKLQATQVKVLRADALAQLQQLGARSQRFGLIFLDPPYQQDFLSKSLPLCRQLLAPGGLVYTESGVPFPEGEDAPEWLAQWEIVRADKAGMVHFYLLRPN